MAGFVGPIISTTTGTPKVIIANIGDSVMSAAEFAILANTGIKGESQVSIDLSNLDVTSGRITDIVLERSMSAVTPSPSVDAPSATYGSPENYRHDMTISGVNISAGNDQAVANIRTTVQYDQQANWNSASSVYEGLLWYYRLSFLNAAGELAVDSGGAVIYKEAYVYCNGKPDSKEIFEVMDLVVNGAEGDITLGVDGLATLSFPDVRTKTVANYDALATDQGGAGIEGAHWADGTIITDANINQDYINAVDKYTIYMGVLKAGQSADTVKTTNGEQYPQDGSTMLDWYQLATIPAGPPPTHGTIPKIIYVATVPLDKTVFYWVGAGTPVTETDAVFEGYQHEQQ